MIDAVASTEPDATPQLSLDSQVILAALSVLPEGDVFVVGDPVSATYLTIPDVGVAAIRVLQAGGSIRDATRVASDLAGEPVDVLDFVGVLLAEGLVRGVDGTPVGTAEHGGPSWLELVPSGLIRPLFSRAAWTVYTLVAGYCVAIFCLRPSLWPSFHDFFFTSDPAVCVVISLFARMLLASIHEVWHWLGARAVGVGARFRVSRRLYYVVFETDLSQLWSVPRRQRYSPLLAGMAFDILVLGAALSVRSLSSAGLISVPELGVKIAAALVLGQVVVIGWQMTVFLRTDLYAVMITALGCTNLYRVNQLAIKRRFRHLPEEEARTLEGATTADRLAVRWFSWVSMLGLGWAAYVFCAVFIPTSVVAAVWMFARLGRVGFATREFWEALVLGAIFSLDFAAPLVIFIRERAGGLASGRAEASNQAT